jgi:hypothetical protein
MDYSIPTAKVDMERPLEHLDLTNPQTLPTTSARLVLRAFLELLRVDLQLLGGGFSRVYESVPKAAGGLMRSHFASETEICRAVDFACVLYFKEVRCLQRSAATIHLLRKTGIAAEMLIGVQPCPFRAHAWVEVAGRVVGDKSYTSEKYLVIDRL